MRGSARGDLSAAAAAFGEQSDDEGVGAGRHHRDHVRVQRVLVLLPEAHAVILDKPGVVPDDDFTLAAEDTIRIFISGIGTLENPVAII